MRRVLFLLFFVSSLSYAVTYQTVTMDAVRSNGNVWTVSGTMDSSGVVRTTGSVAVSGTSRSLAVRASADMGLARLGARLALRAAGPVALALAAYDIYQWLADNDVVDQGGEFVKSSDLITYSDSTVLSSCSLISPKCGGECVGYSSVNLPSCLTWNNTPGSGGLGEFFLVGSFVSSSSTCFTAPASYMYQGALTTGGSVKVCGGQTPSAMTGPMTDADWQALTIPDNYVASAYNNLPSLKTAGVPIDASTFQFAPFSDWTSEPYFKNGEWYRDKVDVSACPTASNPLRVCVTSSTVNSSSESTDTATVPDDLKTPDAGGTTGTETTDFCKLNPKSIACSEMDEPEDPDLEVEQLPVNPDYTAWAGNAVCPASVSFVDPGGYEKSLSFQPTCDFLAMMKPILICVGFCIAAFILFGSFRTTEG